MARQIKNSRINPKTADPETETGNAAARKHAIDQATGSTTGQAGLDQGNRAKRRLRRR